MSVRPQRFMAAVATLAAVPTWLAADAAAIRRYEGRDAPLGVSFSYPDAWQAQEARGSLEPYHQVRLRGPRNREDTYTAYMIVRSRPSGSADGASESAQAMLQRYRELLPEGSKIDRDVVRQLAGQSAHDLVISYTIPPRRLHAEPPASNPSLEIPVTTRTLFLERGQRLYELVYSADARDYRRFAAVFERLLETLEFR
jgi:hypothetical protein